MNRTPASSRRARRAFTLLELILVLVLVAIMLTVSTASLQGFYADRKVDDAASHLIAMANQARQRAVQEAVAYELHLAPDSGEYWLATGAFGFEDPIPQEWGRRFELPQGVSAWWSGESTEGQEQVVTFSADGSVEPFSLLLVGGGEASQLVTSVGSTGRFRTQSYREVNDAKARISELP